MYDPDLIAPALITVLMMALVCPISVIVALIRTSLALLGWMPY
jgi:hypothetical protein